jgi:hypothetical protein
MAAACCSIKVEDVLIEDRNFVKVYELILVTFSVDYIETRNRFVSLSGQHSPVFRNIERTTVEIESI